MSSTQCKTLSGNCWCPIIFSSLYIIRFSVPNGVPTSLRSIGINSNTLLLSWHATNDEITNGIPQQYCVEITDRISADQIIYTTNETYLLVDDLQPNHKYTFRVAILTDVRGPFSKPITVMLQGKLSKKT